MAASVSRGMASSCERPSRIASLATSLSKYSSGVMLW